MLAYCGEARGNASLALKLSGFQDRKTDSSISSYGSQLARDPAIRKAIEAFMQAFAMSAAEVTWNIRDLCDVSPEPFFEVSAPTLDKEGVVTDPGGKLTLKSTFDVDDWAKYARWVKAIQVDPKTNQVTHIELHDRAAALRDLAKILRLFTDQPIYAFNLYVNQMSDEELLREIMTARAEEDGSIGDERKALKPGEIEVPPPPKQEE